ncbi:hypothetical protein DCCM_0932 [Desulfocucumis palustris]|uniref:Uncharacterized protein n=1 Tax=Desulfocucumis palustris TaxID=1898651 RepID=A0A2L2XES5_9FIRM|nr:hypothetical protein [Desulfocucumis palustris]GBF32736.1 hypothetical protein DCCM_0932 [Desulfocucumis palustris]
MFPQTHVYFAERVLGKLNDAVALGSIFPDMAIGAGVNRDISHSSGRELLDFMRHDAVMIDFARGNITHGVEPDGLDYYGDEKNPPYERGYCFEKGRRFIDPTIEACNIPGEMGWWKAHNIVEMGIELHVSQKRPYGEILRQAFDNGELIDEIGRQSGAFFGRDPLPFYGRIAHFPDYIDLEKSTPESLARKYDFQMYYKHRIRINLPRVARLIDEAAQWVESDLEFFFSDITEKVKKMMLGLNAL